MSWRSYSAESLSVSPHSGPSSPIREGLVLPFRERRITQGLLRVPLEEVEFDINSTSIQDYHSSVNISESSPELDTPPMLPLGLHRASDSDFSELSYHSGPESAFLSDESTPSHNSSAERCHSSAERSPRGYLSPPESPALPIDGSFQAPRSDPRGLSASPSPGSVFRAPRSSPRESSPSPITAGSRLSMGPTSPRGGISLRSLAPSTPPPDGRVRGEAWQAMAPSIGQISGTTTSGEGGTSKPTKLTKGWLVKRGGTVRTWRKRWFVLSEKHLRYFADRKERDLRGVIDLTHIQGAEKTKTALEFTVTTPRRTFLLRAEKESARDSWIERISARTAVCKAKAAASGPTFSMAKKELKILPSKSISDLQKAVNVKLASNKFTEIPSMLFSAPKVKSLDLSWNFIAKLSPEITLLSELQVLNLNNNLLTELPVELFQLTRLRVLKIGSKQDPHCISDVRNIHKSQLTYIPPEIGCLTNLVELTLSRNLLRELPAEMRFLTKLQHLNLSENKLTELPYWIQFYRQLRVLDLRYNKLRALPSTLSKLHQLELLNISGNDTLKTLPLTVGLLKRLNKLIFDESLSVPHLSNSNLSASKKSTTLVPELKMFPQTKFTPSTWRLALFGAPQTGKTSLVLSLLRHDSGRSRGSTTAMGSPGALQMSSVSSFKPSSSIVLPVSDESSSPAALGRVIHSSPKESVFATYEWKPQDDNVTFLIQDMDRVLYDNFLHHLVAPRSHRAVMLFVYRANEPLEPQNLGPALQLLHSEYPRAVLVLVGTVAPGEDVTLWQEKTAPMISGLTAEFQCASYIVDPADSKSVKHLAIYISGVAAQRQKMSLEEASARFLVTRNAIELDLHYFAASPFLIWSSWVNYLRHCGCHTLEEVSAATEYLTEIGDIIPLQSDQSSWIVFSADWALRVSLWPSFSIWLSRPLEYTNALESELTEDWERMDPAFRFCMAEGLRKELKRVRKFPC